MSAPESPKPSPIIFEQGDAPDNSCSFDSPCNLTRKDRLHITAFAALAILISSLAMVGFYWFAMKFID